MFNILWIIKHLNDTTSIRWKWHESFNFVYCLSHTLSFLNHSNSIGTMSHICTFLSFLIEFVCFFNLSFHFCGCDFFVSLTLEVVRFSSLYCNSIALQKNILLCSLLVNIKIIWDKANNYNVHKLKWVK